MRGDSRGPTKGGLGRGAYQNSGKLKITGMIHFGSQWKKNHVLRMTYCEGHVRGAERGLERGGTSEMGGHQNSGKLKVTGMIYFGSHWKKNHVIHRTNSEGRV